MTNLEITSHGNYGILNYKFLTYSKINILQAQVGLNARGKIVKY